MKPSVIITSIFCAAFLIGCLMGIAVNAGHTAHGRITLRDGSNSVMGYIDSGSGKVAVKDKNNKLIGWVDQNNTWAKNNSKVANSRLPGLLFCK